MTSLHRVAPSPASLVSNALAVRRVRKPPLTAETLRAWKVVDFLQNADVVIADSQYDAIEYPSRRGLGHTCADDTVQLAARAGVQQLSFSITITMTTKLPRWSRTGRKRSPEPAQPCE